MHKLKLAHWLIAASLFTYPAWAAEPTPSPTPTPIPQTPIAKEIEFRPLPGALDHTPVFNSNNPEIVQEEGLLLSTLPAANPADQGLFLNYAFKGPFSVFAHHIAKDQILGERQLYLGLLAHNPGSKPVAVKRLQGASYLSQPDALFKELEPVLPNNEARIYAGPGDRVATEMVFGSYPLPPESVNIPAFGSRLLYSWPIPTHVPIPPPINGRSTLLRMESQGPVYLTHLALFAKPLIAGVWIPPGEDDYQQLLASKKLAGPRENAPTPFDPASPPPKGTFRYGRVAGVSRGDAWQGKLLVAQDHAVGVPIAALYLNRLGTGQNQSAPMLRRYPETAYQAHGNYGVTYELKLSLQNNQPQARSYALSLSHPVSVAGDQAIKKANYLDPPNRPVMFRGTIRLDWKDTFGQAQRELKHVVLRHGQLVPPFAVLNVPGRSVQEVQLKLIYPADATPPQLLTVEPLDR